MKVLTTIEHEIDYHLSEKGLREARRALNLHYVKDENCNHYVDGKIVSKYPQFEKDHPEFKDAHYRVNMCRRQRVAIDVYEDGSLTLRPI